MAIDGTPPFKIPPGARWLILNDNDILPGAQVLGGTGPFVVPAGKRFVVVSLLLDVTDINPGITNVREVFFVFTGSGAIPGVEFDTVISRVPFGITIPPQTAAPGSGPKFPRSNGSLDGLCIPLRGGTTISVSGLDTPAGNNQIICCQGYLEAIVG